MTMNDYEKQCIDAIRSAKVWESVTAQFELLAHEAGIPDDWKDPNSSYTLETVVQQIENYYGIELFRRSQQ